MDRRGGTRQIVDLVDFDIEREGHVMADKFKAMVIEQVIDVAARAGEKIIDADDAGAVLEQSLAKMRTQKSSPAGHKYARFKVHASSPQRPSFSVVASRLYAEKPGYVN
jgi:hypothetical protein